MSSKKKKKKPSAVAVAQHYAADGLLAEHEPYQGAILREMRGYVQTHRGYVSNERDMNAVRSTAFLTEKEELWYQEQFEKIWQEMKRWPKKRLP